jgi:hypothetical protein
MNFLKKLKSHKGGLIRLKTELFWYGKRGWDNNPERISLILDAVSAEAFRERGMYVAAAAAAAAESGPLPSGDKAAVHLLIDGSHEWIWAIERDLELISTKQEAP